MRQQISSTQTSSIPFGDDESFDARDTGIIDVEQLYFIFWLFAKEFVHLNRCIVSQMRGISKCAECQKIISSIIDYLNLFHSNLTCEYCRILLGCCVCEESIIQNNSPAMHISISLSCSQTKNINKKNRILKNKIETVDNNIQRPNGELAQQDLLYREQKIEDKHYASYDGSLMWIISEFEKKFYEAESGQKTSIYSPIFYTSPSGYNMRARLDLNGDGDARGTHMSIFLIILKGEHDTIITWPFDFPVTFCLFDQSGECHHIIDAFRPDKTSASCQRPASKENVASGILKFCPLAVIKQQENRYIQNGKMYIKIEVDFLGIPRPILPFTLGLNPGLSAHEQEVHRRMEKEKHEHARAVIVAEMNRNDQEVAQRSLIHLYPPVPVGNTQQPPPSTTNSESMQCEDVLDNK